ncbi:MAG: VanZ family protein [Eggerthellaceae bacterium]|nr:VanZ family protein [Eggerthellaceae bacterium]
MVIPVSDILVRSMSGYLFMLPIFALYFMWLKKTGRAQSLPHTVAAFVFGYYLFGLLTVTGIGFTSAIAFSPDVSWTPFVGMVTGPVETVLNIVLFVPLGFFLPLLYKSCRSAKAVALVGFLLSLAVEFFQMFGWGSSDINDLMTNTVGTCIGFLAYRLLSRVLPANLDKQLQSRFVNATAEVIFFAVCAFAIMITAQTWFVHGVLNIP